eukprot:GILJ01004836.1.p1 GENE.GILJ01004836.1~~GILJ01004836.1.p1  ORF type:complete len:2747 (+),score=454.59 GILJ01004836.1:625-8241(+)
MDEETLLQMACAMSLEVPTGQSSPDAGDTSSRTAMSTPLSFLFVDWVIDSTSALAELGGYRALSHFQLLYRLMQPDALDLKGVEQADVYLSTVADKLSRMCEVVVSLFDIEPLASDLSSLSSRAPSKSRSDSISGQSQVFLLGLMLFNLLLDYKKVTRVDDTVRSRDRSRSQSLSQQALTASAYRRNVVSTLCHKLRSLNVEQRLVELTELLMRHFKQFSSGVAEDANTTVVGQLLKVSQDVDLSLLKPFFPTAGLTADHEKDVRLNSGADRSVALKAKLMETEDGSRTSDVFEDWEKQFLVHTLLLAHNLHKQWKNVMAVNESRIYLTSEHWPAVLSAILLRKDMSFARRHAKNLLLAVCRTKAKYHQVRDLAVFDQEFAKVEQIATNSQSFTENLVYADLVTLVASLSTIHRLVSRRSSSWLSYVATRPAVISFLFESVFSLHEEALLYVLRLLAAAVNPSSSRDPTKKPDNAIEGRPDNKETRDNTERRSSMDVSRRSSSFRERDHRLNSISSEKGDAVLMEICGVTGGTAGAVAGPIEPINIQLNMTKLLHLLPRFARTFLLHTNVTLIRKEAKTVVQGLWNICMAKGTETERQQFFSMLTGDLPLLASFGKNAAEFLSVLSSVLRSIQSSEVHASTESSQISVATVATVASSLDTVLHSMARVLRESISAQVKLLTQHQNASIYSTVNTLVDAHGYYLESEPCLICHELDLPFSIMKLDAMTKEMKYTDSTQIIKFNTSYVIQSLTLNIHDPKGSKLVRTVNIYYNNKPVADVLELKNQWNAWKKVAVASFKLNQTECKVEFPVAVTARNLLVEYQSFYENPLASERMQCPRCSRPVADRHGVCKHCNENAYQCRHCRNINYEKLDAFLCNECGVSRYAKIDLLFYAKVGFAAEKLEREEDRKKAVETMDSQLAAAHRKFQQLSEYRKVLSILSRSYDDAGDVSAFSSLSSPSASSTLLPTSFSQLLSSSSLSGELSALAAASGALSPASSQISVSVSSILAAATTSHVNVRVTALASVYEKEARNVFDEMMKSVQMVIATRTELIRYLNQKRSGASVSFDAESHSLRPTNRCYGCAITFLSQVLSLFDDLSSNHPFVTVLLNEYQLLEIVVSLNSPSYPAQLRTQARKKLCWLTQGNLRTTQNLTNLMVSRLLASLASLASTSTHSPASIESARAIREDVQILVDSCQVQDSNWEVRLQGLMRVFLEAVRSCQHLTMVADEVLAPCLQVLISFCQKPSMATASSVLSEVDQKQMQESVSRSTSYAPTVKFNEWHGLEGTSSFAKYKSRHEVTDSDSTVSTREKYLATKYVHRWTHNLSRHTKSRRSGACKFGSVGGLTPSNWMASLLTCASSPSVRLLTRTLLETLCAESEVRALMFLDYFANHLETLAAGGPLTDELLHWFRGSVKVGSRRSYLAVKGFLPKLCRLIRHELNAIEQHGSFLSLDLNLGYGLKRYVSLLSDFLEVPPIQERFKREGLMEESIDAFLRVRGYVWQKNKLIDDSRQLLQELFSTIQSSSDQDKQRFMAICIRCLDRYDDGVTPLFIFEQLCNIVCPEKPEPTYLLNLNKAPTQEEFIRGSMTKNPYQSTEIGPLIRDVRSKICADLNIRDAMEIMELLVANQIVGLDLPVRLVYEKVWKRHVIEAAEASGATADMNLNFPPMTVIYRLAGVDGEATENRVESIPDDSAEEEDPEVTYKITQVMSECGGLEAILLRLDQLQDFNSQRELADLMVKLLSVSCKIQSNRRKMIQLNATGVVLSKMIQAMAHPNQADLAEKLLLILESVVLEANRQTIQSPSATSSSSSSSSTVVSQQLNQSQSQFHRPHDGVEHVSMFLERMSNNVNPLAPRLIQSMSRVLPFLTYGQDAAMELLAAHFLPHLDFEQFDASGHKSAHVVHNVERFVEVAENIPCDSTGSKLKSTLMRKGVTSSAVDYIKRHFPLEKDFKSEDWSDALKRPALPFVLQTVTGLCRSHAPSQILVLDKNIIPVLHRIETLPGIQKLGGYAENLLEALKVGNPRVRDVVDGLREHTRQEKRRLAELKREEMLAAMGLKRTGDKSMNIVSAKNVTMSGMEDLEEEEGHCCIVCQEGYGFKPQELLGVYVYCKRIPLGSMDDGAGAFTSRSETVPIGYSSVTHFNCIHFGCHKEAAKADRALKVPKEEWDGATLRNSQTKCNNLLPIQGPAVSDEVYANGVDRFFVNLQNLGRSDLARFRLLAHDLKALLLRFAYEESFSSDSRGGGPEHNMKLIPYMYALGLFLLEQKDGSHRKIYERGLSQFLNQPLEKFVQNRSHMSSGESVPYMLILSLFLQNYDEWEASKLAFIKRAILLAVMQDREDNGLPLPSSVTSPTESPYVSSSAFSPSQTSPRRPLVGSPPNSIFGSVLSSSPPSIPPLYLSGLDEENDSGVVGSSSSSQLSIQARTGEDRKRELQNIFECARPLLIFIKLIDEFQKCIKKPALAQFKAESWAESVRRYLKAHDQQVSIDAQKVLSLYTEKLLVLEQLEDFVAVMDLSQPILSVSASVDDFILSLIQKYLG